jgi:uncharacterized protein with LGFP repeats
MRSELARDTERGAPFSGSPGICFRSVCDMSPQGFGQALWRAALGLVTIGAAVLLLAPTAAASPESDADDAITAVWEKAGGDNSVLGAKVGDVYAIGDGFGQDFDGGKMFFTPGTGARALYGAVLDKYESVGGPAGSDLGFPTINEVPGLSGPDSRVSTFSASDNPVIFWTPDHGAFVVRGAINAAWDRLGSSGGVLGVPLGDETYSGESVTQPFIGGQVSWNRVTKVFSTIPTKLAQQLTGVQVPIDPTAAINMAWRAAGGPSGPLGAKQGGQYPIGKDGLAQNFAGGKVFFSFATGANAVESDILAKYDSLGGPVGSDLGFPIANEADGGIKPKSRISTFSAADKPVIFWTPDHGAFVVRGAMKAAWDKLGGPTGKLGAPMEDQTVYGDVISQKFTGGKIAWNRAKNTFGTEPANLASSLSGLKVPGQNQPASPASAQPATGTGQGSHWWWWLAVIPALLLIAILALIARRPRRIAGPRDTMAGEPDRDLEPDYDAGPDAVWPWSNRGEGELGPPAFVGRHPEPPGPPPMGPPFRPDSGWMPAVAVGERPPTGETGGGTVPSEFDEGVDVEDPDAVDTAPQRVPTEAELRGGRHAAADDDEESDASLPAAATRPTIHLPLEDPHEAPEGYPVKGNASFGLYYTPDSNMYEDAFAEIWFASEEIARANGFTKGE